MVWGIDQTQKDKYYIFSFMDPILWLLYVVCVSVSLSVYVCMYISVCVCVCVYVVCVCVPVCVYLCLCEPQVSSKPAWIRTLPQQMNQERNGRGLSQWLMVTVYLLWTRLGHDTQHHWRGKNMWSESGKDYHHLKTQETVCAGTVCVLDDISQSSNPTQVL